MRLLSRIIGREGEAYTNRPSDRGGPTKYGITIPTLAAFRDAPVSARDIQLLERAEAEAVYSHLYLEPFAWIPDERLREAIVDYAVHSGVTTATRALQTAARVEADGRIGPITRAAVLRANPAVLRDRIFASRLRLLGALITTNYKNVCRRVVAAAEPCKNGALYDALDSAQALNAAGWMNRVAELLEDE